MIDAARLKELREERGMTQAMLADDAGISREHYNRLERWGGSSVTANTLSKLCRALGVEVGEIWRDER